MAVQVIPIPTEVVSHSLPFPFPILCFIPIPMGFRWDSHGISGPIGNPIPMHISNSEAVGGNYLHHKDDRVERNHGHYEIVERLRDDELPDSILERKPVLRHVATSRPGVDSEVDALLLQTSSKAHR